ncbi:MAG TPA: SGNH/GDSL hydrolase family protein [Ignavibacteriaceae bacterium]|nr:SGNH/GDSL hydrolase family protein [Ignavibacteriaceae bacterium]
MKYKIAVNIVYNAAIVLAAFFLFEGGARIFFPDIKIPGTQQSLLKDGVYYDSQGLKPYSSGLSSDVLKQVDDSGFWKYSSGRKSKNKILLLGDSVTMGVGVENDSTFAGILNNSSDSLTILNPALIGYSSHDYKNIIEKLIADKKNVLGIKYIFIFWCMNDVYSNLPVSDSPEIVNDSFINKVIIFLRNNSHLYHLLKSIISDRPKAYYLYDKSFYRTQNTHFRQSFNDLIEISHIAEDYHLVVELFFLPYEYQLRDSSYEQRNFPQKLLSENLKDTKIKVRDCSSAFNIDDVDEYYLYGDGIHLSYKGHKAMAEYIEAIRKRIQ